MHNFMFQTEVCQPDSLPGIHDYPQIKAGLCSQVLLARNFKGTKPVITELAAM